MITIVNKTAGNRKYNQLNDEQIRCQRPQQYLLKNKLKKT